MSEVPLCKEVPGKSLGRTVGYMSLIATQEISPYDSTPGLHLEP